MPIEVGFFLAPGDEAAKHDELALDPTLVPRSESLRGRAVVAGAVLAQHGRAEEADRADVERQVFVVLASLGGLLVKRMVKVTRGSVEYEDKGSADVNP